MEILYYYLPPLQAVRDFFELGGEVLIFIAGLTVFMWCLIIERLLYLRWRHRRLSQETAARWRNRVDHQSWHARQIRDLLVSTVVQELERNVALIRTCVALCPLLGLLGTVTGMVEVFEVMAISGSGNPRSMAAGVSKATVPTMAGMVAALSGVAMSAYLQRTTARERVALGQQLKLAG